MSADTRTMPFTRTVRVGDSITSGQNFIPQGMWSSGLTQVDRGWKLGRTMEDSIHRARAGRADERDWNKLALSMRCECCRSKPGKRCRRTDVPAPSRPIKGWKPPRMDIVHDARRALAILAYGE